MVLIDWKDILEAVVMTGILKGIVASGKMHPLFRVE